MGVRPENVELIGIFGTDQVAATLEWFEAFVKLVFDHAALSAVNACRAHEYAHVPNVARGVIRKRRP